MPLYEEFLAEQQHVATTPDNKVRVQTCLLGSFLPCSVFSNISAFRGFWDKLESAMGHETSFLGFDWGKERLSVSIYFKVY